MAVTHPTQIPRICKNLRKVLLSPSHGIQGLVERSAQRQAFQLRGLRVQGEVFQGLVEGCTQLQRLDALVRWKMHQKMMELTLVN